MEKVIIDDLDSAGDFLNYLIEDKIDYTITQFPEFSIQTKDYDALICKEYIYVFKDLVKNSSEYENDLIFGKDKTEGIVSIEVEKNKVILYKNNGTVETRPMIYWIMAPEKYDKNFKRLQGDQHYKYIRTFTDSLEFGKYSAIYKKRDVFSIKNEKESAMIFYGLTLFKGLKVADVSVLAFDIESEGLSQYEKSKVFLITNTYDDGKGRITKKHFRLDHYSDDCEMIEDWCNWVVKTDPTVLVGHNFYGYDIPYLNYCYGERNGIERSLPLGKKNRPITFRPYASKFRVDGNTEWNYVVCHIHGRHIVDTAFLAVKYDIGRNYPSWGLKQIVEYEGLVKEGRQFYDAAKIAENWDNLEEREKIVSYGIDDSDDALALYRLMIPSLFYMTQSVPKPFQLMCTSASGAQLNAIMIRAYLKDKHSIPKANESRPVAGGISFGIPGIHHNVLKIDVTSLYPSIIRQFCVYPLKKDPKMYYYQMVEYFTIERLKDKKKFKETGDRYYDDQQAAKKIFVNSTYGLTSTSGLNFNDFDCGNFITGMGRQILKETIVWATNKELSFWWNEYESNKDIQYDNLLTQNLNFKEINDRYKLYD